MEQIATEFHHNRLFFFFGLIFLTCKTGRGSSSKTYPTSPRSSRGLCSLCQVRQEAHRVSFVAGVKAEADRAHTCGPEPRGGKRTSVLVTTKTLSLLLGSASSWSVPRPTVLGALYGLSALLPGLSTGYRSFSLHQSPVYPSVTGFQSAGEDEEKV